MSTPTFNGLRLRSIGPAFTSGRISGIAVDPNNASHYLVSAASGGVWKTVNAGITWTPVFDREGSYSIGCIVLDPKNPLTVWVGTGENNSQRSVSYGNGVYRSDDGGKTWKNVGLKASEHIGRIAIDPKDSKTVYVAAQGPLWGPGGDRGLFKTTDGGKTWKNILNISENTGVRANRTRFTRRHINGAVTCGRSSTAGRRARSTNRPMPARRGTRCARGCRRLRWAVLGSRFRQSIRTWFMRRSKQRIARAEFFARKIGAAVGKNATTLTRARCTTRASSPTQRTSTAFM